MHSDGNDPGLEGKLMMAELKIMGWQDGVGCGVTLSNRNKMCSTNAIEKSLLSTLKA